MISPFVRIALVLGLLSAVGPFAVDMYLPALPTIAADLQASTATTQMTLTAFFAAFGLCQIIYGPIADAVGRKPPLYVGLALFAAGSVGAVFSGGIGALIACRVVQGIGAAAVMVVPRAIIRDLHTGVEATRLMSLIMLVISVSPLLAPLTGSALIVPFGWRAVFVAVAASAGLSLILTATLLPETRPPAQRVPFAWAAMLSSAATLMTHRRFLALTFIAGLGFAGFFVYIAGSSFLFIDHFGLTPTQYSLAFALNAIGFLGLSQFTAPLGARLGMLRMVVAASALYALFALVLLAVTAAGIDSLAVLMALLFAAFACLGLVIPTTSVLALEEHGANAGMASALGGTLQMLVGGVMIAVMSLLADGTALPMVATIAFCAVTTLLITVTIAGDEPVAVSRPR